jgi:hypothetical protein
MGSSILIKTSLISIGIIIMLKFIPSHTYQSIKKQKLSPVGHSFLILSTPQEKKGYQFVGAEKCASTCHNNDTMGFQYNRWEKGPHSEAFVILSSKQAGKYARRAHIKTNPQVHTGCLKCHITGSELDSTYFAATYKKEEGVTCEACHKKISDGKTYLPKEADCLKCHNGSSHKMNKFNFIKDYSKIVHTTPETNIVSEENTKK